MKQLRSLLLYFGAISVMVAGAASGYELMRQHFGVYQNVAVAAPMVAPVEQEKPTISGQPLQIEFPAQRVSVAVAPGYYDAATKTWNVSKDKAHFAVTTAEPNNKTGNTFIYGHNRWQVFTALLDAKVGDTARIHTDNGHVFTYTLIGIHDTDEYDVSYLQPTAAPTLTVQTCSGVNYQYRRMLTFSFTEVR